ncbi:hypothetical protein T5B8_08123 [Salinisphaera sp. T5B8]|uniref:RnfH family protein n=1 Tax=Salinisphaera sp. T5B8 TaxID=1304154 RepID=UPI00333F2335
MSETMAIEVVLALPGECLRKTVHLTAPATAEQALRASGLDRVYRERVGHPLPALGVYGRKIKAEQTLKHGDRLELYRPLTADPRQRRRAKVDARRRGERSD